MRVEDGICRRNLDGAQTLPIVGVNEILDKRGISVKSVMGPPLINGSINATGNGSISCNIGVAQIKPTKINLSLFGRLDGEFGEVAVAVCGAGVACCGCRCQRVAADALQQLGHVGIGVLTQGYRAAR